MRRRNVRVWFEYFETTELLIQCSKRLEFFGFLDLLLEPVLDLDLFNLFQILMIVVQMSGANPLGDTSWTKNHRSPIQL